MKTQLAIALSCFATVNTYASTPTFYGFLDVSIDQASEKLSNHQSLDKTYVHSNGSIVGTKGEIELTEDLSAIYQADWAIYLDGQNTDFSNRTRFIGLKSKSLGTLKVGQHDTPLKSLSGTAESFSSRVDGKLDLDSIMLGENRLSNAIVYQTPKIKIGEGDLNVTVVSTTGEGKNAGSRFANATHYVSSRGFGETFSTSAVYNNKNVLVGVAYDNDMPSFFASKRGVNGGTGRSSSETNGVLGVADTVRIVGRAKVQNFVIKGLYQHSKAVDKPIANQNGQAILSRINSSTLNKAIGWLISTEYNIPSNNKVILKATYGTGKTDYKNNATLDNEQKHDLTSNIMAVGSDYVFNQQVKAYGQVGHVRYKAGDMKDKATFAGIGLEYKF